MNIDIQISTIQMFSLVYIHVHDLLCDGSPSTTHDEIRFSCLWTGKLCWAFSTNLLMIWECQNCRKRGHSHLLNQSFDYITPAKTQFNGQRLNPRWWIPWPARTSEKENREKARCWVSRSSFQSPVNVIEVASSMKRPASGRRLPRSSQEGVVGVI